MNYNLEILNLALQFLSSVSLVFLSIYCFNLRNKFNALKKTLSKQQDFLLVLKKELPDLYHKLLELQDQILPPEDNQLN